MHDALVVQVRDSEYDLTKDLASFGALEASFLDEVVEQFSSRTEFRHEVDGRLGRDQLVQRQDVRVPQSTMMVDLAREQRERGGWI